MITNFNKYSLNETYELSGKHSFLTYLQIVSNHDYHFISNDTYRKLYKYHVFFSTETITGIEDYVDIFKYKHSLSSAYEILLQIKDNKLAFFFGIKENSTLRYGFLDLDTQRSYVVGEFMFTKDFFGSISKYKSMQFVNKVIQNTDAKKLPILSKIKQDCENFYKGKKKTKVEISDNKVIIYITRDQFTDDDINMNRPFRSLDNWASKKMWRNKVECSVDDEGDPIKFILIVK